MGAGFFIASTLGSDSGVLRPGPRLHGVDGGRARPGNRAVDRLPSSRSSRLGKAGVGSAVNDVTRELGGTFGVAVVGAVFSSVYGPHLAQLLHGRGLADASPRRRTAVTGGRPPGSGGQTSASAHAVIIDAAKPGLRRRPQPGLAGLRRCRRPLQPCFAFLVLPRRLPNTPPSPPTAPGSKPGRDILSELSKP